MTRLISAELFKLRKRLMPRVLLYVLLGIIIILYIVLLLTADRADIPGHGPEEREIIQNMLGTSALVHTPFTLCINDIILPLDQYILTQDLTFCLAGWRRAVVRYLIITSSLVMMFCLHLFIYFHAFYVPSKVK